MHTTPLELSVRAFQPLKLDHCLMIKKPNLLFQATPNAISAHRSVPGRPTARARTWRRMLSRRRTTTPTFSSAHLLFLRRYFKNTFTHKIFTCTNRLQYIQERALRNLAISGEKQSVCCLTFLPKSRKNLTNVATFAN